MWLASILDIDRASLPDRPENRDATLVRTKGSNAVQFLVREPFWFVRGLAIALPLPFPKGRGRGGIKSNRQKSNSYEVEDLVKAK